MTFAPSYLSGLMTSLRSEAGGPQALSEVVPASEPKGKDKTPSRSRALVKLDFLLGTKWGSNAGREQKRPSRSPNRQKNAAK